MGGETLLVLLAMAILTGLVIQRIDEIPAKVADLFEDDDDDGDDDKPEAVPFGPLHDTDLDVPA